MSLVADVIMDSREVNSEVPRHLDSIPGLQVEQRELYTGDYQISEEIIFERKTWDDLWSSLIDGRLFQQLPQLKEYKKPCILLEGDPMSMGSGQMHVLRSVLLSIALGFQVPIIPTMDEQETAQTIHRAVERLNRPKNKVIPLQNRPKPKDPDELEQFLWESFPNIGPVLAKTLTEYPGTLLEKLNTLEEIVVPKLGPKKKQGILEVLNHNKMVKI